ncbi:MAG: hypothetical protein JSV65_09420 [Armatimonadota bacterium]|nr:MAG: hypothetical protein JSV65_09420 [Armatimonadota bacterium]
MTNRVRIILATCLVVFAVAAVAAAQQRPRLRVRPDNPHWFQYRGHAVALFGSGLWTIIPDASVDIADHNRWYAEAGANANRATLFAFCTTVADGNGLAPWPRTGPGSARNGRPKFDLDRWDERFWQRLHEYFSDCERRGIFVLLQMFDEPYIEGAEERWGSNPLQPENNINDIPGLPREVKGGLAAGAEAAFYDPDNQALMRYQDALIQRLLDETASRYGNIIYEIGNEINMDSQTPKQVEWQRHWIDFFQRYERERDVKLLLTNDTRRELAIAGANGFPVINDHGFGLPAGNKMTAEAIAQRVSQDFADFKRPIINSRPVSDPDRSDYPDRVTEDQGRRVFWSYLLSGGHVIGFRTTEESWKGGCAAERIVGELQRFVRGVNLTSLRPRPDLVTGGLCLADPGVEYVVYLPEGGSATVDLRDIGRGETLPVVLYDPRHGTTAPMGKAKRARTFTVAAPEEAATQDWVFHIGGPGKAR